ncbi:MAG: glycerol-3-phosphate cytidylyltransferase [Actinomycetes bacterium]|jgi:glycerol-3-phosphate cytidylyltransferase|nr:glycerol-3-phosphate cytidylyltransferase [Actinomycetes bacterium]
MKRVLTYGTFDLLHHGHIRILRRAREMGDYLVVAVSTDEFNAGKGKKSYMDYATRAEIVAAIRYVDKVIPERSWEQKVEDIVDNDIDIVVMGDDWADSDRFDYLRDYCELVFLPRTEGVSTTEIKEDLRREGKLLD